MVSTFRLGPITFTLGRAPTDEEARERARLLRWEFQARFGAAAEDEWRAAEYVPPTLPKPSTAGQRLNAEGREWARMCASLAAADPSLKDTAIAARVAEVLTEQLLPEHRLSRDQMRAGIEKLRAQEIAELLEAEATSPSAERRARIAELRRRQLETWPAEQILRNNFEAPADMESKREALAKQINRIWPAHKPGTKEFA